MIEIFKGLIDLVLLVIREIFFIEIPIYNDHNVYFGVLLLTVAFVVIAIVCICKVIGFDFFEGDDD